MSIPVFLVLANKQTLVKTLVWKIYIMKGNVCVQRANTHLCCFYFLPYSIFIYHLFIFINIHFYNIIHYYPCSCNACSCGLIFWLCLHKLQIRRNRFHGRLWSSLVTFVLVRRTQTKHIKTNIVEEREVLAWLDPMLRWLVRFVIVL